MKRSAAFVTKDGKVTVHKLEFKTGQSFPDIIQAPFVTEHITEPIDLTNIDVVKFKRSADLAECPCCGTHLVTYREL
ncbi:MAG: hypothetical protein PHU43_03490 [Candidatus Bipolaricaulis sp.]|nr:hypothetical protein [Candidatus Bipolaricaulis sp.]